LEPFFAMLSAEMAERGFHNLAVISDSSLCTVQAA
jgi:hypothetical protein